MKAANKRAKIGRKEWFIDSLRVFDFACRSSLLQPSASADQDQQAQAVSLFITDMLAASIGQGNGVTTSQRRFSNGVTTVATPFQSSGK